MRVRLRLRVGPRVARNGAKNLHVALGAAALLWPMILTAYSLALWALAAQLRLTGDFAMDGLFSHWQVWAAIAIVLNVVALILTRYGRTGDLRSAFHLSSWFSHVGHARETEPNA